MLVPLPSPHTLLYPIFRMTVTDFIEYYQFQQFNRAHDENSNTKSRLCQRESHDDSYLPKRSGQRVSASEGKIFDRLFHSPVVRFRANPLIHKHNVSIESESQKI